MSVRSETVIPQFLVNLGNRFAVFGPEGTPPASQFSPEEHIEDWPRVADEEEIAAERIARTLTIPGMNVSRPQQNVAADLILRDGERETYVELKVRGSDPKSRDYDAAFEQIKEAHIDGRELQVWFVNLGKLKTVVVSSADNNPEIRRYVPWDVWSVGEKGPFKRAYVIDRVNDWERRIGELYASVREWISESNQLVAETTRTIVMSEELMQTFAVTDRELRILDVLQCDEVICSLVPRGLWVIGSRGRIDLITRTDTRIIVDLSRDGEPNWQLVDAESRPKTKPFGRSEFLALVSA